MCQLSYIAYKTCSCQYFYQEPEYCDYVEQRHRDSQGGTPRWVPHVLVYDATETLDYLMDNEILFQTQDKFDPIKYNDCQQIEPVLQEIGEQCPWHGAKRTSEQRADIEQRAKEARKREEQKKKDARRNRLRKFGALSPILSIHSKETVAHHFAR